MIVVSGMKKISPLKLEFDSNFKSELRLHSNFTWPVFHIRRMPWYQEGLNGVVAFTVKGKYFGFFTANGYFFGFFTANGYFFFHYG